MFRSKLFSKHMAALLVLVFCTAGLTVFSQEAGTAGSAGYSAREAEENILLNFDDNATGTTGAATTVTSAANSTFWLFVRMIVVLAIVIGIIYLIVWLLKKSMDPGVQEDEYLKKTASLTLAPGKSVQVVTLGDQAWVLGVSEESVSLISEIQDKELINAMNIHAEPNNAKKPLDFASMLANVAGTRKKSGFTRTEDFIKDRRDRFSNRNNQGDNK